MDCRILLFAAFLIMGFEGKLMLIIGVYLNSVLPLEGGSGVASSLLELS